MSLICQHKLGMTSIRSKKLLACLHDLLLAYPSVATDLGLVKGIANFRD